MLNIHAAGRLSKAEKVSLIYHNEA